VAPQTSTDRFVQTVMQRAENTGRYVGGSGMIMQALGAATIEEATEIGAVYPAADFVGSRLKFIGVTFMDSDPTLEARIPLFALADVVRDNGDGTVEKLSCGAEHVLGVLIRACELEWFPFDGVIESVDLGSGRKALNLTLAPTKVASTSS
jgi:hypothetical protein